MKALTVLYGGDLYSEAFEPVFAGKSAFDLALEKARSFPGTEKLVLLGKGGEVYPGLAGPEMVLRAEWTASALLEELARLSPGYDFSYFAWADCPFLDAGLAGALAERHLAYRAEYSYADGWPYGLAPELLSPGTAGILKGILGENDSPVERDLLFQVIQKDINSFDIETEISPVDLRYHRLSLSADSRRNLFLLRGLAGAGFAGAANAAELIAERPELLRTLPNFYPVQAARPCPQSCSICPYPRFLGGEGEPLAGAGDFMGKDRFEEILEKIIVFSGDGVIDLSLWGELSLHPEKLELVRLVLARPALSLVIETSGLGWTPEELERLGEEAKNAASRINRMAPLSWIVSLDARDPRRYQEIRGAGYAEAENRALRLLKLFPKSCYVQAVRLKGSEDDIEQFYRYWKENSPEGANIIIQKYDDFCGFLPRLQASDLSPIKRRPCRHLLRDMPVLLDGTVPVCREDLGALNRQGAHTTLGNIFSESPETIWARGETLYREHCQGLYSGICAGCDEYYTFNF